MPRKSAAKRLAAPESDGPDAGTKSWTPRRAVACDDLVQLYLKACLIARDAAFNLRDLLTSASRMAFLAIKDCEKELDLIERQIDERHAGCAGEQVPKVEGGIPRNEAGLQV